MQTLESRISTKRIMLPNGCHGWTGSRAGHGYATIWLNKRHALVHRIAYEQMFGAIPKGMEAHHTCDNKGCVNPLHIIPVTHAENMWLSNPSEYNAEKRKTHCPKGHPYSGDNLMLLKHGYRACRTCNRTRNRKAQP